MITIIIAQAWVGFIALFFGGFFTLFIQLPALFFLRSKKHKGLKFYKDNHITVDWWLKHSSWLVVSGCFLVLYTADTLFGFSVDPFAKDNFQIEVTLNPDKTCEIVFDGKLIAGNLTYEWEPEQNIYCHSLTNSNSVIINLGLPKGKLLQVGSYPLTAEVDIRGNPIGYGGAFFSNKLGSTYSPSMFGSVFWKFVSGTFAIDSVTQSKKNMTIIVGKIKATGKRHHEGA